MAEFSSERAQASFIGFAIGDAYGRELEFLSGVQVRTQRVRLNQNFQTSDETHMAMYTAQAILKNEDFNIDQFGHALGASLMDWVQDPRTQQSAPSKNCLLGVQNYLQHREWRRSGVPHSDGSGSIMRICPIAIAFSSPRLEQAAEISALITHSHPNALATAVSCARLLRKTLEQGTINAKMVLEEATIIEKEYNNAPMVSAALRSAVLQSNRPSIDWLDEGSIPPGDGGWKAASALGLALTAVLHYKNDPRTAIDKAARINGDSDGVAALTGMFMGAALGFEALPLDWVQSLIDARDIASFADNLCRRTPQKHWMQDKCTDLEKKGARFSVQSDSFLIKVPQTSTAGILALRAIAEELGVGLEVEGGAVVVRIPQNQAPPSFVARYTQQPNTSKQTASTQSTETSQAHVIDENQEEIWDAEVLEDEPSFSHSPPPKPKTNPFADSPPPNRDAKQSNTKKEINLQWVQNVDIRGKLGLCTVLDKNRSIGADLDRLRAYFSVDALMTMLAPHELETFGARDLEQQAGHRKITVYQAPCSVAQTPEYKDLQFLVRVAIPLLSSGKNVVCYGAGSWGQSGTLASCILIGCGLSAKQAMRCVRFLHPNAIENIYQEQCIYDFAQKWNMK